MTDAPTLLLTIVRSPEHDLPGHVERPTRFDHFDLFQQPPLGEHLKMIDPQPAPLEAVLAVHPQGYLDALEAACRQGPAYIDQGDTYVTPASYPAALAAAGGALAALNAVLDADGTPGFALVRPPGHHATATQAMGFCLLNNVAICARAALAQGLQRILIVDFDVHHGNGTQAIFEEDPSVLYISTHQRGIYPGSGSRFEVGRMAGEGKTINIPLPPGTGDEGFQLIMERVIAPAADRFGPDLLLLSAGYDAHWNDPLASLALSCSGYHQIASGLAQLARRLAKGRVLATLEGGYNPEQLAHCLLATMHGLLDMPAPPDPFGPSPRQEPDIEDLVAEIADIHGLGGGD
jgi:acetoin utilization deacetylase AcuC-like enzyme